MAGKTMLGSWILPIGHRMSCQCHPPDFRSFERHEFRWSSLLTPSRVGLEPHQPDYPLVSEDWWLARSGWDQGYGPLMSCQCHPPDYRSFGRHEFCWSSLLTPSREGSEPHSPDDPLVSEDWWLPRSVWDLGYGPRMTCQCHPPDFRSFERHEFCWSQPSALTYL